MTSATALAPWGCLFIQSQGPQLCLGCFYHHPLPSPSPIAGNHGWVLPLCPHRVTNTSHCHTFSLIDRWNTNHPLPAQALHATLCYEQDTKPSCVTLKAALHPHPKSSALSTTRTGSVLSVSTGLRACGAGGKWEETRPQVMFPVPSTALALISATCCGGKHTLTKPRAGWKATVTQHLQNPQTVNGNLLFIIIIIIITTI